MSDNRCCCSGTHVATPRVVDNRPGLPRIAYRSGVHGDFLASMLADLTSTKRPQLAGLRTRDPDDPTIALIDSWAVVCDVLTFYNERLAQESYLTTATERTSLQELGKLIAYRLDPGVAAETYLAFSLERPPAIPPRLSPDPGLLPPGPPTSVTLPERLRVQSVPGPGQKPQTFETVEEVAGRPEWSSLPVVRYQPWLPSMGKLEGWFVGVGLNIQPGMAILYASTDLVDDRWDVRLALEVEEEPELGRTRVWWGRRGLGSINPPNAPAVTPDAFVLRKRLPVFGHTAPVWRAMNQDFRQGYVAVFGGHEDDTEWPGFQAVKTTGSEFVVDLDGSHPDVRRGDWVVLSREDTQFYRELYQVVDKGEQSRSEFGVSGPVTRLTLTGEGHDFGSPRDVTVLAVQDPLTITEAPDGSPVAATSTITVEGDATAMETGRTLIVGGPLTSGPTGSEVVTLAGTSVSSPGRTTLELTLPLTGSYERDTAVVFGNVARATHGETVSQVLGDGDAATPFQELPLVQGPLTYVQADNADGSTSTLDVSVGVGVDNVAWRELPSLYGAGPRDHVYATDVRADGSVVAEFGDGVSGARLPTGSHNVQATYRIGLGAAGNVDPGQISQPMDRPLGLKAATNPVPASGGVDPEPPEQARLSMPLTTRTLGRAVSLTDYADFAMAFAGIALADARVLPVHGAPTIALTVCGPGGGDAPATTLQHLATALHTLGDPLVRVQVLTAEQKRFRLALKIVIAPDHDPSTVLAAVGEAVRTAFAAGTHPLATPVHRSAVIAVVAAVPGVVAVDLDLLYEVGSAATLEERLLAEPARVSATGTVQAAQLLALSDSPFDWLENMT